MTDAGKCLRLLQRRFDISTVDLAQKLDCHAQQVFRWRNQSNMKLHTLQKICAVAGITLDDFVKLNEEQ
ncbi:MAG: helix-turn-helix domain-containing protein [Porticoccaceae bacterium]|jgi:transposase-like protein